ncbi:hypothetical protein LCGC14_1036690 [marine sediment metagenome]|uniref:Peptidase S74 domain-containing protein n=1 Tax=marine sediment metagenome TaxID=412755 RepID=A0A0F9MT08_9ZZZZ
MTIGRIKSFPYPERVDSIENMGQYLKSLYLSLTEEQVERITDTENMVIDSQEVSNLTIVTSFKPTVDNAVDIGATTLRFKDLYLSGSLKDDTVSLTVANAKDAYDKRVDTWGDGLQISSFTASVDFNTTNLKITSTELDTIQGIATNATPTFAGLTVVNAVTEFSTDGTMGGDSDSALPTEKAVVSYIKSFHELTNEPTGFENRTDSTLSWGGTRTLTIAPSNGSFDFYQEGTKYTKSSSENIQIEDTPGVHFIYYEAGSLTVSVNPSNAALDTIYEIKPLVTAVYWNVTDGTAYILGDERHGFQMDGVTHRLMHNTDGALWGDGLTLSGYTLDTGSDAALTFEVTDGEFFDQDITHAISDGTYTNQYEQQLSGGDAVIPILYRDNVDGTWKEDTASTLPYKVTGTGRLAYNNDDGDGTFSQIEVADNKFMSITLVVTHDWQYPVKMIQGQNEYTDKKTAVQEALSEILSFGTLPTPEITFLYRLVMNTKDTLGGTKKAKIVDVTDLRGSLVTGSTAVAVDHGVLSGLADPDHNQYILHSLADAANDFLVASGNDAFAKQTSVEVMATLSGAAGAAFAWNSQNLTGVGTIASADITVDSDLVFSSGSITSVSNAINFGNEALSTTGTLGCGVLTITSSADEALKLIGTGTTGDASIGYIGFYDSNGSTRRGYIGDATAGNTHIYLRAETGDLMLSATGTVTLPTGSTVGNLTLANGSITDSGGAISFGDENLSTTGDITVGHLGLGGAGPNALYGINYEEVLTDTDNTAKVGMRLRFQLAKTAATMTSTGTGVQGWVVLDSTNTQNWTDILGLRGVQGVIATEASSTGTITGAASFLSFASIANAATVTNLYGYYVGEPTVVGNKVTNLYGIYVGNQALGATLNYALYTNAGLVHFGDNVDITGTLSCGALTSTGIDDNATSTSITIDSSESVGIGGNPIVRTGYAAPWLTISSTAPGMCLLDSNGANTTKFFSNSGGVLNIGIMDDDGTNPVVQMEVRADGKIKFNAIATTDAGDYDLRYDAADGVVYNTSDMRQKTNMTLLGYGLAEILQLQPKRYTYYVGLTGEEEDKVIGKIKKKNIEITNKSTESFGLIAQEVFDVIPEAVYKPIDETVAFWGLRENRLIPILINAIKELNARIEVLEA